MEDRGTVRRLAFSWGAFVALICAGCASFDDESRTATMTAPPVPFRAASIQYEATPPGSTARLACVYPHPDGVEGMALAEVFVPETPTAATDQSGWRQWASRSGAALSANLPGMKWSGEVREAWSFDVPVAELDRALRTLSDEGFFNEEAEAQRSATISVNIDGANRVRRWRRSPALDAIMARVREDGRLISHSRPLVALTPPEDRPHPEPNPPAIAASPSSSPVPASGEPLFGPP